MLDGRGRGQESRVRLRPRAQGGAMGSQRAGAAEPTARDRFLYLLTATRLRRAPGGARVPGATRRGGGDLRRV